MKLTRREALLGAVFSLPVATLLGGRGAFAATATAWPSPILVAVTGIKPESTADRLKAVIEPFVARELAVCVGVDPVGDGGSRLEPRSSLAETLREISVADPHLVELALDVGALNASPYFDLRKVSDAQAAFTRSINRGGYIPLRDMLTAATVVTSAPPKGLDDFAGLRAAGIRTIVHLTPNAEQEPTSGYWMTGTGVAKVFDSGKHSVVDAGSPGRLQKAATIAGNLRRESAKKTPLIVQIGLQELGDLSDADLQAYAVELADAAAALRDKNSVRSLTPFALYTQNREGPLRYVVVRVDDYRLFPARSKEHENFTKTLLAAGIPVTEAVIPGGDEAITDDVEAIRYLKERGTNARFEIAGHGLNHTEEEMLGNSHARNLRLLSEGLSNVFEATGELPRVFVPPNNAFDNSTLKALGDLGIAIMSAGRGGYERVWGLDDNGILHLSNTIACEKSWSFDAPYFDTDEMLEFFGTKDDAVFMLHPQTVASPEKARRIWDLLKQLASQPGTELVNCGGYYDSLMPDMPELGLLQAARSRVLTEDTGRRRMLPDEERALKQDAATAWEYFDHWWDRYGGLVPATSWEEYGRVEGYAYTTMWDVATVIMANIAVHRMGMVDQRRFEAAMNNVLKFLRQSSYRHNGALLPNAERSIGKSGGAARGGFDSADTGRLLIALKVLDDYTSQTLGIGQLVESWGLAASIVNGEMCDLRAGKANSVHWNAYAHYAGRGYAQWGVEFLPVFDNPYAPGSVDSAMFILSEMKNRGRIATEPHTTEEVELGASDASTAVADALLAAQMKRYEETGTLTCASEGPLNQNPWFAYQGYQLGPDGGTWVVDAPNESQDEAVKRAGDSLRLVSTKGCFLWAATRPGAYSDKLLSHVRRNAKTNGFGFSSGIFETTGKAAELADVNTNGIILEAISYMLNGRKPLLEVENGRPESLKKPSDIDTANG